jgi:soluble cytochrome b562
MFRDDLEALPQQLEEARAQLAEGKIEEAQESATAVETAAASLRDRIDESLQGKIEPPPK